MKYISLDFSFILIPVLFVFQVGQDGQVVRRPTGANMELNFNPGFYISLFQIIFQIAFSILFRASPTQIVGKISLTEFSFKAFRSEIKFHTNPGLSHPSFNQPNPEQSHLI